MRSREELTLSEMISSSPRSILSASATGGIPIGVRGGIEAERLSWVLLAQSEASDSCVATAEVITEEDNGRGRVCSDDDQAEKTARGWSTARRTSPQCIKLAQCVLP